MAALLPLLMAYSLIGETLHEIAGSLMLVLFVAHHVLNRKAISAMLKGRQTPGRAFAAAVNILLFVFMILQPLSGILMSKHLYTFLPTEGVSYICRSLHLPIAYWGFVLMSVHAGFHVSPLISRIKKNGQKTVFRILILLISLYGLYAFISRGFPGYMSGAMKFAFFDYSEPRMFFLLDHLAVMIMFGSAGWLILTKLNQYGK